MQKQISSKKRNSKNNSTSKIMAVIIIIIILLLGGALGTILGNRTLDINNIEGDNAQNGNQITIGSILIMPLYYLVCYPRVLINLAAGEYTESCGSPIIKSQKVKKQFIQNKNN